MTRLAWLATLCACSGDPTTLETSVEPREPAPYLPELDVPATTPAMSTDDVAAAIESRFAELVVAVPTGFPDVFDGLLALAEPGCPAITNRSEGSRTSLTLEGECTTSAGTSFQGAIEYSYEAGRVEDGSTVDGMEFFARDLRVETNDGRFVEVAGYFAFDHRYGDDFSAASSYCTGRMSADDATAGDDPWLSGRVEGLVSVFVGNYGGYRVALVNATVAADDPEISGVSMQDLRWEPGRCDIELLGTGSVREVGGVWHDVVFASAPDDGEVVGCDGCGDHLAAGAPQSEPVCNTDALDTLVDFSGGLPW